MLIVISYDVSTKESSGRKRLRRVAKACQDHGQRVQFSIFECELEPDQWVLLKQRLLTEIKPTEDSLRFYMLGNLGKKRIEHFGQTKHLELDEPLFL